MGPLTNLFLLVLFAFVMWIFVRLATTVPRAPSPPSEPVDLAWLKAAFLVAIFVSVLLILVGMNDGPGMQ
jgi:hypothetical protein